MARIQKYSTGITGMIKHNIREFKEGICPTNLEVDPERTHENYSIIRRGTTAKEIEKYRKKIENICFHYKRKNIIHANEVICTLPADCPPDQEREFFLESYRYICSTLPMGEKCVFLAEVHADEGRIQNNGKTIVEGAKHLHVMYVPAVPDTKHEGYEFRLCSDALTKRPILQQWHPKYQKWLDDAGIQATVASGTTSGRGISVKSLKEISKATGLSLEQIKNLEKENQVLYSRLMQREQELAASHQAIAKKDSIITELKNYIKNHNIHIEKLQRKIESKDRELLNQKLKNISVCREREKLNAQLCDTKKIIFEKDIQLDAASKKLIAKEHELIQVQSKIKEFEAARKAAEVVRSERAHTLENSPWGTNTGWGNSESNTYYQEEKLW